MSNVLEQQRTYALVGTGGSGKTSLAEMLLFQSGVVNRLGKIEDGTSSLDYEPEEIKRRGSIQPAFATFTWQKNRHFLADTPGDNNFIGDITYLVSGVDGVVFVVDAVDGVRPLTRKLWKTVKDAALPAMVFINKMDRDRADFDTTFAGLADILGIKPVLLYVPIGQQETFRGVVDVLAGKAYYLNNDGSMTEGAPPEDMAEELQVLRETMVENVAESDEVLMEKYLEEGELTDEEVHGALRKGVLRGELTPVTCGSALTNKGGVQVLDLIQNLFPSPLDRAPWMDEAGNQRASSPDEPVSAFVIKTLADPFAGHLNILRVLSGTLQPDSVLFNANREETERVGTPLYLVGKEQAPCKEPLGPGALVAVAKLKNTSTGDTLCTEKNVFMHARPHMPPTLITYALAPKEKGDEDKVYAAMQKLLDEEITLRLTRDEETADILLSGMGQMHIETAVERARRRYKVEILLKTPKVPYRETIKAKAQVQGRHKKQSGGRGQFGDCWVEISPLERGSGYAFEDAIVGGAIPRQYIPAVDKGIQEAACKGYLAGYPLVDFKARLYDGSYHNVDSSEMAFKIAGSLAFKKAMEACKPQLLEPIMLVSVSVPDEYMGDIIGDLSSRRGKVLGSDSVAGATEIKAHIPMNEIMRYAPDLRSMTGGQGVFTMEFAHYEEAPPHITDHVRQAAQQDDA